MKLALFQLDLRRPPVDGQLAKSVDQPLFLDHGQVAFPALLLVAVVVPHGPAHLLVVHGLRPVGLHLAPGPGKVACVIDLEHAGDLVDPADDLGIVGAVVQHVPDENIERGEGDLGLMFPRPAALS